MKALLLQKEILPVLIPLHSNNTFHSAHVETKYALNNKEYYLVEEKHQRIYNNTFISLDPTPSAFYAIFAACRTSNFEMYNTPPAIV